MEKVYDHLGNEFESPQAMCKHYRVYYKDYLLYLKCGRTLEYILTKENLKYPSSGIGCSDHLGNQFESITDMCKYWGIHTATYYEEINRGDALHEILERPRKVINKTPDMYKVKKHTKNPLCYINGKAYYSLRSIALGFSVPPHALYSNMKKYNSIEKSLKDCIVRYHEMCESNMQS